jgi:hypothetical protein
MQVRRRSLVAGAAIVCALAFAPARALASTTMETTLMDDRSLIYSSPSQVEQAMQQIRALGVDRIKVSMVWYLVAPGASSTQRPNFDATDPNAYPRGAWDRYDLLVKLAQALGIQVYFQFDPPVPHWAIPAGQAEQSKALGRAPHTSDFEQFVEAVGRRYSGTFVPADPMPPDPGLLGLLGSSGSSSAASPSAPLPRVSYWGIWNEPDEPQWLNPLYRGSELAQPSLYRGIVNATWAGLQATGHSTSTDTILVGETANSGTQAPADFIRALYCVNQGLRPLSGAAASRFGCPTAGSSASFVRSNPGLFYATGFAHHPYSFDHPPNRPYPMAGWITMYNLAALERELNAIFSRYGTLPSAGVPLYLTEFGYESNPPKPCVNSAAQQAIWLNEAEYMAWKDPYVRSWNQFELVDNPPVGSAPGAQCAGGFQTGLELLGGGQKPSFDAFRIPIWLPVRHHGRSVEVWGQLRPANHSQTQYAVIEFQRRGRRSFRQLAEVPTTNSEGFVDMRVRIPAAGFVRLAWLDSATGSIDYSRMVSVS